MSEDPAVVTKGFSLNHNIHSTKAKKMTKKKIQKKATKKATKKVLKKAAKPEKAEETPGAPETPEIPMPPELDVMAENRKRKSSKVIVVCKGVNQDVSECLECDLPLWEAKGYHERK